MDHWYEIYVFTPSVLSCVCSVLLMVKFTIGSNQKFFFHQMSAILAFFDTVQCMGIFLDAPWLNKTCYPAAYLFMAGSLCKVLAIMYITSIITHAIFNLEAPSKDRKLLYSCLAISSGVISTVMMTMGGTAEILCFDKDPVTFNYNDVSFQQRRMFFVFYAMPLSVMFFLIMFLTVYSIYRLRIMIRLGGNRGLVRLLRRLIPLTSIFFIAFMPTAIFFFRGYFTDHENHTNKTIAILGQVLSGTLYALVYAYFCHVDYSYVSDATKRILEREEADASRYSIGSSVSECEITGQGSRCRATTIGMVNVNNTLAETSLQPCDQTADSYL